MKEKDLRVGNIVQKISKDTYNFNGEGTDKIICNKPTLVDLWILKEISELTQKEYFPIKLTVQWLYELGFKSDTDETDEFILNGFRIYKIGENLEFANHDFPIKIEFVHQLQNLFFALTRTELVFSA